MPGLSFGDTIGQLLTLSVTSLLVSQERLRGAGRRRWETTRTRRFLSSILGRGSVGVLGLLVHDGPPQCGVRPAFRRRYSWAVEPSNTLPLVMSRRLPTPMRSRYAVNGQRRSLSVDTVLGGCVGATPDKAVHYGFEGVAGIGQRKTVNTLW